MKTQTVKKGKIFPKAVEKIYKSAKQDGCLKAFKAYNDQSFIFRTDKVVNINNDEVQGFIIDKQTHGNGTDFILTLNRI